MPVDSAWLAAIDDVAADSNITATPAAEYSGDPLQAAWLPNESLARAWMEYIQDTQVEDSTPPPTPKNLRIDGNQLEWEAEADLQSGLAGFIIERDGEFLVRLPEEGKNRFGRPVFQNLQYSDTPTQPLVTMQFVDKSAISGSDHTYRIVAINTVGLKSPPSDAVTGRSQ
jgi:hypothetical protein